MRGSFSLRIVERSWNKRLERFGLFSEVRILENC